jgi:hypothetical protein
MSHFNVLHLLIASGVLGAVAMSRREAAGRSLTAGRLFVAPVLALLTSILMLALAGVQARAPGLWIAGLASGLAVGAARGIVVPLQVDRVWDRLRVPHARDGLWAGCLLGGLALGAFVADVALASVPTRLVFDTATSAAAAGCAGYLAGRASSLWLRTLNAPHSTWRVL